MTFKQSIRIAAATLCALFACALPQQLGKTQEVGIPTMKPAKAVQAIAVPKVQLAVALEPEAVTAPVQAPQAAPATVDSGGGANCGSDPYLAYIYQHESGCCPTKWQGQTYCPDSYAPSLSAYNANVGYGLCQSTPAIKMANAGADWGTNWTTQDNWCRDYAISRYGSTYAAYSHWLSSHNW